MATLGAVLINPTQSKSRRTASQPKAANKGKTKPRQRGREYTYSLRIPYQIGLFFTLTLFETPLLAEISLPTISFNPSLSLSSLLQVLLKLFCGVSVVLNLLR